MHGPSSAAAIITVKRNIKTVLLVSLSLGALYNINMADRIIRAGDIIMKRASAGE